MAYNPFTTRSILDTRVEEQANTHIKDGINQEVGRLNENNIVEKYNDGIEALQKAAQDYKNAADSVGEVMNELDHHLIKKGKDEAAAVRMDGLRHAEAELRTAMYRMLKLRERLGELSGHLNNIGEELPPLSAFGGNITRALRQAKNAFPHVGTYSEAISNKKSKGLAEGVTLAADPFGYLLEKGITKYIENRAQHREHHHKSKQVMQVEAAGQTVVDEVNAILDNIKLTQKNTHKKH